MLQDGFSNRLSFSVELAFPLYPDAWERALCINENSSSCTSCFRAKTRRYRQTGGAFRWFGAISEKQPRFSRSDLHVYSTPDCEEG